MTSTIDQQFVEYIVKSLVGNPDAVKIDRRVDEKGVLLELTVDPEDLGRVIGKKGATAQSLRTLLRALGTKNEARYNLKIVDNGEPRPPRDYSSTQSNDNWGGETQQTSDVAQVVDDNVDQAHSENATSEDEDQNEDVVVAPEQEMVEEPLAEEVMGDDESSEDDSSDRFHRTRKELEDLDDLDI